MRSNFEVGNLLSFGSWKDSGVVMKLFTKVEFGGVYMNMVLDVFIYLRIVVLRF